MSLYYLLTEIFLPSFCLNCGCYGRLLCPACARLLHNKTFPQCYVCGQFRDGGDLCSACRNRYCFDGVITVLESQALLRHLVHQYKYNSIKPIGEILADHINRQLCLQLKNSGDYRVLPVPLHPRRQRERGYNQSLVLAEYIERYLQIPLDLHLQRVRATQPQMTLNREERQRNLKEAFRYRKGAKPSGKALLIDDVITTGTTVNECSRVLKGAGYHEVTVVALSRGT